MRALLISLLLVVAVSGCAGKKASLPAQTRPAGAASTQSVIVTPDTGLSGKVARVNLSGRFVVLTFPIGHLPAPGQTLYVYHLGLKSGELKVTGPQVEDSVVADLVQGEAFQGDVVRDR